MDKILITQVYASLLSLEKKLSEIKQLISERKNKADKFLPLLTQYEEAIRKMRKTANILQLNLAKNEWSEVVRNTEIFYGLTFLVRGEILITYGKLLRNESEMASAPVSISSKENRFH